jgi:hypothetical protein
MQQEEVKMNFAWKRDYMSFNFEEIGWLKWSYFY